nr:hypothetical protein [uncultured Merdimonas sp.]
MKQFKKINYNNVDKSDCYLHYETVDMCPICKAKIAPVYVACSLESPDSASVFDFCRNCNNTFVTKYAAHNSGKIHSGYPYFEADSIIYSEPNRFTKQAFNQKITALSPQFDKIYNQALAAESSMLDEIAGLGYRKALEFLIKDFAIHEHPDEEEDIKAKPLAQCIKKYIENENITTLAERSTWIGNDEAHYIRKQEDRDVSDMKDFIQAIVYFIGMILITEDAASMAPKK